MFIVQFWWFFASLSVAWLLVTVTGLFLIQCQTLQTKITWQSQFTLMCDVWSFLSCDRDSQKLMSCKKFSSPKDVVEVGLNKNHMSDRETYLHLGRGGWFKKAICVTGRCLLLSFQKMKKDFSKGPKDCFHFHLLYFHWYYISMFIYYISISVIL